METQKIMQGIRRNPVPSACLVLVLILLAALYYRSDAAGEAQAKLDSGNKVYAGLKNNLAASIRLDEDLLRLSDVNKRIEAGLLRSGELARNQQLFYKIEADTGVKLVDLRQQPLVSQVAVAQVKGKAAAAKADSANPYVLLGFTVTLEGKYEESLNFIRQLERSAVLSKITTLSSSALDGGRVTMTMNLQVLALR